MRDYHIDCDLRQGYLLAAIKPRHCREMEQWQKTLAGYGYATRLLDMLETREIIATRRYCGSLFDENSGHLHPLKYALVWLKRGVGGRKNLRKHPGDGF